MPHTVVLPIELYPPLIVIFLSFEGYGGIEPLI